MKKTLWFFIMAAVIIAVVNNFINLLTDNDKNSQQDSIYEEWAVRDDDDNTPLAKVIVAMGEASRNPYISSHGEISGELENNMAQKLSYVSVSYGIYVNDAKVGSCIAVENNIPAHGTWRFKAQCMDLPDSAFSYRVDDVTYW